MVKLAFQISNILFSKTGYVLEMLLGKKISLHDNPPLKKKNFADQKSKVLTRVK